MTDSCVKELHEHESATVITELVEHYSGNRAKFKGITLKYDGKTRDYDFPIDVYFFAAVTSEYNTAQVGSQVLLEFDIVKTYEVEDEIVCIPRSLKSITVNCPCEYVIGKELSQDDKYTITL